MPEGAEVDAQVHSLRFWERNSQEGGLGNCYSDPKKKAKKDAAQTANIIYALAPGEAGENGIPKLTKKFGTEGEAVLEAFKQGVPYHRMEKWVVQAESAKGGMRLVGVSAS